MRNYRALISVPIAAATDTEARRLAGRHAVSIVDPSTELPIASLEVVGEMAEDSLAEMGRIVWIDRSFFEQLPADWRT